MPAIEGKIIPPGTPTQVAHPGKTTLRTVVQTLVAVAVGIVVLGPPIIDAIVQEPGLPEQIRGPLLVVSGVVVAVGAIATRIMAIPGVNDALTRIGLGTGVETETPLDLDATPPPAGYRPEHRATPPSEGH